MSPDIALTWNARAFVCGLAELGKYWTRGRTVNGDAPDARLLKMRIDRGAGPLFSGRAGFHLMRDAFHRGGYRSKATVPTFAAALKRELSLTRAIQADPWKHLPAECRDGWSRTDWLANGPTPWLDEYRERQDKRMRVKGKRQARKATAKAGPRLGEWMAAQ